MSGATRPWHGSTRKRLLVFAITVVSVGALVVGVFLVAGLVGGGSSVAVTTSSARPPHGGAVVFASDRGIYVANLDGSSLTRLSTGQYDDDPVWSPDGKRIAFERGEIGDLSVIVMNADGSGKRRIARSGSYPAWSPDGTKIAFEDPDRRGIFIIDADGIRARRLTAWSEVGFSWSPDGKRIAYTESEKHNPYISKGPYRIRVVDIAGDRVTTLRTVSDVWFLAWSPDGTKIAFGGGYGGLNLIDTVSSQVTKLTEEGGLEGGVFTSTPVWSPDSSEIAFIRNGSLFTIGRDGRDKRRLTSVGDTEPTSSAASWSADGSLLVYPKQRVAGSDASDIWLVRADGTGAAPITHAFPAGATYNSPDWAAMTIRRRTTERISALSLRPLRILKTPTRVLDLSADNSRAAVATSDPDGYGCGRVAIWDASGSTTSLPGSADYYCSDAENFVLAGSRAAWMDEETSNTLRETDLIIRASGSRARELTIGDHTEGDFLGNLAGDGPLLVYNTWRGSFCQECEWWGLCCRDDPLRLRGGPVKGPKLWRIVGERTAAAKLVLAGPDAVDVVAVDAGRIAVLRPDGMLVLLNDTGKRLSGFRLGGRQGVGAVRLTGSQLVARRGKKIEVRDATSGKVKHRWPLASSDGASITFEDAQGSFAVYTAGIAIHLLRLSNGHDRVLAIAKQAGPAHADLEPEGLYYSYNETGSAKPGRVAFVPLEELRTRFR